MVCTCTIRRYDEVLVGASGAGSERGAEMLDCFQAVCARRIGLRGGPARDQPDLPLAPGACYALTYRSAMQASKKLVSFIRRCWEHVMSQAGKTHDKTIATRLGNSMSFQASALTSHGWAVRRLNWHDDKAVIEMDTAKRFCAFVRPELINFQKKLPEYDSVDIIGRSADESISENFQIVRLWEGDFWKKLKTSQGVDKEALSKDEFCRLIDQAVNRKLKYPPGDRKTLILLIDASPIRIQAESEVTSYLNTVSDKTGFKEIRLVGLDQVV